MGGDVLNIQAGERNENVVSDSDISAKTNGRSRSHFYIHAISSSGAACTDIK